MAEVQALLRRQRNLRTRLVRVQNELEREAPLTGEEVAVQLELLEEIRRDSRILEDDMMVAIPEDQVENQEREFSELTRLYSGLKSRLRRMAPAAAAAQGQGRQAVVGIKLPKLDIPKFSGNLLDWLSFHDRFKSAVHDQPMPLNHKLLFLKDALVGEAGDVLRSTETTDENYEEAWAAVVKRFRNYREIGKAHLDRLVDLPPVSSPYSVSLRKVVDVTRECLRSLKSMGLPVEHWDMMLAHTVCRKLDRETRQLWEMRFEDDSFPKLSELLEFLDRRAKALAVCEDSSSQSSQAKKQHGGGGNSKTANVGTPKPACDCTESHPLYKCPKFLKMSIEDRKKHAREKHVCFKCLHRSHRSPDCVFPACKKCGGDHNVLLHTDEQSKEKSTATSLLVQKCLRGKSTLLATAIILIQDRSGEYHEIRALLDGGSQLTFITEDCVQRLGLKKRRSNTDVMGVGEVSAGKIKWEVDFLMSSRFDTDFQLTCEGLIMRRVTGDQPNFAMGDSLWDHVEDLDLADPEFCRSGRIDILLGGAVLAEVITEGLKKGPAGTPVAQKTVLGWILYGAVAVARPVCNLASLHACSSLEDTVREFLGYDGVNEDDAGTPGEENESEKHFLATHSRNAEGRYVVRLPFKRDPECLGDSRKRALRTLLSSEKRLAARGMLDKYNSVLQEYVDMGHMELVSHADLHTGAPKFYMPHHGVIKESSSTTKLRVVFNASAKTTSGISLNDILMVGPKIQDDLFSILVRVRKYPIMLSSDAMKMYRMVLVDPRDRDFQRILWRPNTDQPIREYRLNTVTFGEASAPFQAVRAMHQLAQDEREQYPLASEVVLRDFYIDDAITGANSIEEAMQLQDQLIEMMQQGGFLLRKWSSNEPKLLERLSPDMRETQLPLSINCDEKIKTLGIQWSPASDEFSFVSKISTGGAVTKRTILSAMAKVFDPLGWLSPVTVRSKILFQSLWRINLDWDTPVPDAVQREWSEYLNDLQAVSDLKIDRFMLKRDFTTVELVGFSDSSEKAMAAAVFARSIDKNGNSKTALVAAKTKLVPIKRQTIPKLELSAAVLLSKLILSVKNALKLDVSSIKCYTDSSIVLAWLSSPPSRWKRFVERRVQKIVEIVPAAAWRHVPGTENPADCGSRGIKAAQLLAHPLWWTGPSWLLAGGEPDTCVPDMPAEALTEEKRVAMVATADDDDFFGRFSSYNTLLRVTAYVLRLIRNFRGKAQDKITGPLTIEELRKAELTLVRMVQLQAFAVEHGLLGAGKELPPKHPLLHLSPILGGDGVIRVGGRLANSRISGDRKHPMLLPKRHPFTFLMVRYEHERNLHPGSEHLLSVIGRKFWICGGRDLIRKIGRQCIKCQRFNATTAEQFMANLPAVRVTTSDVFSHVGVDYTGPILMKNIHGRSKLRYKGYVCLFICMATRAIHLELVTDATTAKCLAAIRRFVARRGLPAAIYSDCSRTFLGAHRKLKDLRALLLSEAHNEEVTRSLANDGVKWVFNPPYAPHQGGYWEAGIKSVKHHLLRVMGQNVLNYEELTTILYQIEAVLNSRPLTSVSADPNDLSALTPGHFLVGRPLLTLPEGNLSGKRLGHLKRWQLLQRLLAQFWSRWSKEYITRMQQRPKWLQKRENLQVGQLVLVKEDGLPPLKWQLARIIATHPGPDGLVRTVDLRTSKGETKRAITKVAPLFLEPDN